MTEMLEKLFHLKEKGTTVRTELVAGVTTFMTMAYILAVNPGILSTTGMDAGAVFMATAIGSAFATILMAVCSNYPFALAPGMGLNAFFAFTVCGAMGYSWQVALAAVFIEGIIFILLSITPVREAIFNCIPQSLKLGVTAGIGLFIAFIGMQSAKVVVDGPTLVSLYPFKAAIESGGFATSGIGVLLCLIGVGVIAVLMHKKVPGDILWGILITWGLGIICELAGWYQPNPELGAFSVIPSLSNGFVIPDMSSTFMQLDFSAIGTINFITVVLAFMFVDLFDTLGTLIGVASKADMLDENGRLPRIKGALLADSVGTVAGSVLGTSTISTYVESSAGVSSGGRTGLTAITVAVLFLLSILLAPIFLTVPAFATAPALIVVGFLMVSSLSRIDFSDITESFPAYVAAIAMPFMYSISEGISMGIISYVAINILAGTCKEKVSPIMYILAILFVMKYVMV